MGSHVRSNLFDFLEGRESERDLGVNFNLLEGVQRVCSASEAMNVLGMFIYAILIHFIKIN